MKKKKKRTWSGVPRWADPQTLIENAPGGEKEAGPWQTLSIPLTNISHSPNVAFRLPHIRGPPFFWGTFIRALASVLSPLPTQSNEN